MFPSASLFSQRTRPTAEKLITRHSPESNSISSFGAVEQNWWVLEEYDKIKKCRKKSEVSMWNIFMYLGPDLGPHHSSIVK